MISGKINVSILQGVIQNLVIISLQIIFHWKLNYKITKTNIFSLTIKPDVVVTKLLN